MDDEKGKVVVQVLSCVLEKLIAANDQRPDEEQQMTKFHALRVPAISVKDYLNRVFKYASCSYECFVLALIYIDRVIQRNSFVVNSLNVHRVVITSVMLAAKFFDDQYYNNAYYAKIGGVPCVEMNSLELEFLFLVNFTLHVPPAVYEKYTLELSNHAQSLLEAAPEEATRPASSVREAMSVDQEGHPQEGTKDGRSCIAASAAVAATGVPSAAPSAAHTTKGTMDTAGARGSAGGGGGGRGTIDATCPRPFAQHGSTGTPVATTS